MHYHSQASTTSWAIFSRTCFIVESAQCKTVQIKHSKWHLPPPCPENQGADDLTLRATITRNVPWIRIDVGHDECLARREGIRANTLTIVSMN
jgi:hypothetical protein